MKYPIVIANDASGLSDLPSSLIQKAKNQPVLFGTVGGAIAGYFFGKHPIIGAAIGWAAGMSGIFGKGQ